MYLVNVYLKSLSYVILKLLKMISVNTKWTYINKSNDTKSLPDFIRLDLEFENEEIILNLIKQSPASLMTPFIITQVGGQRSDWKPSDDEVSDSNILVTSFKFENVNHVLWLHNYFQTGDFS